jgi:predicted DNA-binding ribbon-helix-helix protein
VVNTVVITCYLGLDAHIPWIACMQWLTKRIVWIAGRRTGVPLENVMWEALHDIARRKGCSVDALVTEIDHERGSRNLSAAIRSYVVAYYRAMMQAALRGDADKTAR